MIHIAYSVNLDREAPGIVPLDKTLLILINYKFIPGVNTWHGFRSYPFRNLLNCKANKVLKDKVESRMTVYFTGRILNLYPGSILPEGLSTNG